MSDAYIHSPQALLRERGVGRTVRFVMARAYPARGGGGIGNIIVDVAEGVYWRSLVNYLIYVAAEGCGRRWGERERPNKSELCVLVPFESWC